VLLTAYVAASQGGSVILLVLLGEVADAVEDVVNADSEGPGVAKGVLGEGDAATVVCLSGGGEEGNGGGGESGA
jgi:hypothetical protein